MAVVTSRDVDVTLTSTIASLFLLIVLLFTCLGKKKQNVGKPRAQNGSKQTLESTEVVINNEDVKVEIQEDTATSQYPSAPTENATTEEIHHYDPTKSQSQNSIVDPYESIKETDGKKDQKVAKLVTNDEKNASGSGNSETSDNSIYTKVKQVPKKEEIAYAVVDIKESQEKYEVVNGGIVRRQTNDDSKESCDLPPDDSIYEKTTSADDDQADDKVDEPQENSAGSSLYASVQPTENKERKDENSTIDAYAVVVKAEPAAQPVIALEEQEDSGASGFYAKVDNTSSTSIPVDPTPPPPPPPHPANMNRSKESDDVSNYEPFVPSSNTNIDHDLERSNTYDSIKEVKLGHKMKAEKDAIDSSSKKHKHDSKHKQKQLKKEHAHAQQDSKSPKSNRFSRVNPFKLSKKSKRKQSFENIEKSIEGIDETKELSTKDKIASLPINTHKSPKELRPGTGELSQKRHSIPHIPPPLPSVDKLKHLTEHKSRRGSSFDACSSPDSSPRSSPRTPLENSLSSTMMYSMSSRSHVISHEMSSRDTSRTFSESEHFIPRRSVEVSYEEDENYSTVDNTLKSELLKQEDVEEQYSTVDDGLKHDLLLNVEVEEKYSTVGEPKKSIEVEEEDKYSTIDNTIKSDISQNGNSVDDKYTKVDGDLKKCILPNEPVPQNDQLKEEVEEFPDYAVVDLELKHQKRAEREALLQNNPKVEVAEERPSIQPLVCSKKEDVQLLSRKERNRFSNSSDYMEI
eukprot:TCONS_00057768-protein